MIVIFLLLASLAAMAQSLSEDQLAHLATAGRAESLVGVPWQGVRFDPLAYMVDWGSIIDPSVCWVGSEPPGWSDVSSMFKLIVTNETDQFVRLSADGGLIDVVRPHHNAGGLQLPAVIVGETVGGPRRLTALPPRTTCYGLLPSKSAVSASRYGWSVQGVRFDHAGAAGSWLYAGALWLYNVPLFEGARSKKPVFWRGQRETTVVFRDRDFVP